VALVVLCLVAAAALGTLQLQRRDRVATDRARTAAVSAAKAAAGDILGSD
jgi:type II secretory pathway pseudopilin PulG